MHDILPENEVYGKNFTLPEKSSLETEASIIILCNLLLNALWLISTIALLTGVILKIRSTMALLFYLPWTIIGIIIFIVDLIGTIIYVQYMNSLKRTVDWLKLIGVENATKYQDFGNKLPVETVNQATFILPLIYARFFILLLLNFIFLTKVMVITHHINTFVY